MIAWDDLELRFHARCRVWRSYEQNVVRPAAWGAGINEMAADGLRFMPATACGTGINKMARNALRGTLK